MSGLEEEHNLHYQLLSKFSHHRQSRLLQKAAKLGSNLSLRCSLLLVSVSIFKRLLRSLRRWQKITVVVDL